MDPYSGCAFDHIRYEKDQGALCEDRKDIISGKQYAAGNNAGKNHDSSGPAG
jgi:hypothetical protein